MNIPILEMKHISKEFPGVKALNNVSFQVQENEIHCLVGENGAGKSTLMKVLSGVYPHGTYTGDILFNGKTQTFSSINDSKQVGIAVIYQELALVPELTVYENIFLGNEIERNGIVNWNETILQATAALKKVGLDINPSLKVRDISVGKQQLVEIAKALSRDVKLLILDEPTSALSETDSQHLLNIIRDLKSHGVTCILISHKLKEVIDIADTVTVLRDGQTICTLNAKKGEVSERVLIKNMVGREINNIYPAKSHKPASDIILDVKNWNAYDPNLGRTILRDVNFKVKKGEIVGLAGLMGSGRTEIALSLFGNPLGYQVRGEVYLRGKRVQFNHPSQAINAGMAYVTEDRKAKGLILIQDVKTNIALANLREIARFGVVDNNAEVKVAEEYRTSLNIKTPSIEQKVENLSGGNQQKVSVGKWLFVKPDLLIMDDPTRGIDVGAKYEIYSIMTKLVQQGMSIIMISSELPEVLGMSDRVYVVASGKIAGEMSAAEATQEKIMEFATN
jgi:putative multiple sugar transport system ATP-binding protein